MRAHTLKQPLLSIWLVLTQQIKVCAFHILLMEVIHIISDDFVDIGSRLENVKGIQGCIDFWHGRFFVNNCFLQTICYKNCVTEFYLALFIAITSILNIPHIVLSFRKTWQNTGAFHKLCLLTFFHSSCASKNLETHWYWLIKYLNPWLYFVSFAGISSSKARLRSITKSEAEMVSEIGKYILWMGT